MKLLAIETATERCSVALSVDGEVLSRGQQAPRQHAALLLPWVKELLAEAGIRLRDIDALAFSRGPGSFTSLRIGIGVTQGLAWGAEIPVVPVSSLNCAAQVAAQQGVTHALVALDARMAEVFCGRFHVDGSGIMQPGGEERVCAPHIAAAMAGPDLSGVGNGFERYPALQNVTRDLASVYPETLPDATAMIPLALNWLQSNSALPASKAQPVYLRDKVAEKPRAPRP
ncbi:MAG: tRNA (adenosine(37)-N6)-threonylcarbamoyltransferase complex dimerization subunit type 1 TsaB [Xanthomonadales bacterium]|nr:tRNA (adenosine(37)-N6)-threonylcarbamoyltransferase complex dimerization subunit type 1 TsaB [Xanthomonadales bacterium]NNL94099.1 tRNA (adenosine(37)-N6)-threonylcarbamoyltransferase complex dimerization subunit type 1 TsaB [Xanthomonadales bacterium]